MLTQGQRFEKREYTLEMVTPAFLGGADQSAEWRTPGIKALIRQWWRVAYVAKYGVDVERMRDAEGERFGVAGRTPESSRKATITIRFDEEPKAATSSVSGIPRDDGQSLQYLGFGPFVQPTRPTTRLALNKGSKVKFKILIQASNTQHCEELAKEIDETLFLVGQFGTLGSRSSNAWGSVHITGDVVEFPLEDYAKALEHCMKDDWKQAIAKDNQGIMVWQTPEYNDSDAAMKALKIVRKENQNTLAKAKGLRTLINGPTSKPKNENRWPNQFVFKVIKNGSHFRGQVALLAHKWHSDNSSERLSDLLKSVAQELDATNTNFQRIQTIKSGV